MRSATALTLVVGLVILRRHRRRSRRATGLALVALAAWGGVWLAGIVLWAASDWWQAALPRDALLTFLMGWSAVNHLCELACILLLVCATVADRKPAAPTGPESDYADAPAGR